MTIEHYQKMYAILCAAASDAIDLLSTPNGTLQAKVLLEQALSQAEEIYLTANPTPHRTTPINHSL